MACVLIAILLPLIGAKAHDTGATFLKLAVHERRIEGRWEIDLDDLQSEVALDTDRDGRVTPEEFRARLSGISAHLFNRLMIRSDGTNGVIVPSDADALLQVLPSGTNAVFQFAVTNVSSPKVLEIEYGLFFDRKPQHRGLLQLDCRGITQTAIFSSDHPRQRFELEVSSAGRQFVAFGWEGVRHIWIGFDHILFLLALLLPAVLKWEQEQWRAVAGFREAFFNVFKIVTAFTLAHSLTLGLAATGLVQLPPRLVESAIAASVLVAAANNLRPLFRERIWWVAFVFGLIHGFGFANVLTELGLPHGMLLWSLFGFNLGVELGQLAIVSVSLPVAFGLRGSKFYQARLLRLGSVLIGLIATVWLLERVFDQRILPESLF